MEAPGAAGEQSPTLGVDNEFATLPKEHVNNLVPIGQSGRSKIQIENVDVSKDSIASTGELTKKKGVFKEDEASVRAFEEEMTKFVNQI